MNDDKLDLSALDPALDQERWERRIGQVVARAVVARRWSVGGQLRSWARPALGLAAAAAVFSWLGLIVRWQEAAPLSSQSEEAISVLSRWAASDEQPSASSMLRVLGGSS